LFQLEESTSCEEAVTSCLMLWTYASYIKLFCELAKTTVQIICELHEIFYVKNTGKIDAQYIKEIRLSLWKWLAGQNLE
jgi:hypothetical protein|tara:strand:- start:2044 stop:2280 length:237 start_codon:yes stop_codon:yes gene_type:complete